VFNRCARLLGWCWALPLTAFALPAWGIIRLRRPRRAQLLRTPQGWVFAAHSPWLASILSRHPLGEMAAVAVGCCVLTRDAASLARHLPHELVHVQQAQRWGVLFPLAYLANSAWHWCCGRCPYADNYFERQANRAG
jgi:hypothetical protein